VGLKVWIPDKVDTEEQWLKLRRFCHDRNFVNSVWTQLILSLFPKSDVRPVTMCILKWCKKCGAVVRDVEGAECKCEDKSPDYHEQRIIIRGVRWSCLFCGETVKYTPDGIGRCGCGYKHLQSIVLKRIQRFLREGKDAQVFKALANTLIPYRSAQPQQGGEDE
jgi:hypothetical protein